MHKIILAFFLLTLLSCGDSPTIIEAEATPQVESGNAANTSSPAGLPSLSQTPDDAAHTVTTLETLHTERYTYIKVKENDQEFWVAIPKAEIQIGASYTYRGGLLKKDFVSKEHNRTFETLYLVGAFLPANATTDAHAGQQAAQVPATADLDMSPPKSVNRAEGAIAIGDLVKNKAKYGGKTVKITGKVMKVNQMIMNRNWLHLQDGTGNNYDLVVTSTESIPPGHIVTIEGVVALDKDFGAGYRYDILVENVTLVK